MSAAAIVLGTELNVLQRVLDTVSLTGNQWLLCLAGGAVILVVSEVRP